MITKEDIKNVYSKRVHKISNSYVAQTYYRFYKKNGGTLDNKTYSLIIKRVNDILSENLSSNKEIVLPHRMGKLELRKYKTQIKFVDGKLKTNLPVDWDRTLALWCEDSESRENKSLVYLETEYVYTIRYNKTSANYQNKYFYKFFPLRRLKQRIRENIQYNNLDAYMI